jgi:hypothetical protein
MEKYPIYLSRDLGSLLKVKPTTQEEINTLPNQYYPDAIKPYIF